MRDVLLILFFIGLSIAGALLGAPLDLGEAGFGLFPSLHQTLAGALQALGFASPASSLLSSWAGWASLALFLARDSLGRRAISHPAALVLTAGGLGWASGAITLLMISVLRLSEKSRPEQIPLLAVSILFASVCVPQFEWLLPAVASPLFLAAPRSMIRSSMTSFYLVVLTPTIALLAFSWLLGREPTLPVVSAAATPTQTQASLLWLAAPGLAVALAWPLIGRLSLITGVMITGVLTSPVIGMPTALLLGGQALAVLLAAKASSWTQAAAGALLILALWLSKGHIPSLV